MSEPLDLARGGAQRPVVSERSESNQSNGSPSIQPEKQGVSPNMKGNCVNVISALHNAFPEVTSDTENFRYPMVAKRIRENKAVALPMASRLLFIICLYFFLREKP